MESVDGALAFRATLDVDDFNVSANAMEAKIRNISGSTVSEAGQMDDAFANFARNAAGYITTTLVGGGMMGLVNSIIQTRGQFQQLSIAFDTMLGSESKSKALMDQIVNTAAKTPFDLMGVAGGAKQLLAYGESATKVNDTLIRLGNIASGLSIPLNDIVYLYGTTMVQGRLYAQDVRQFTGRGIPLVRELANMYHKSTEEINAMVSAGKIGFPDVEKVIDKMTDSGGQFYNLMEKQSKSLSGMVSNLSDAWDTALNKIGEDNQNVLSAGISAASYVVQHMNSILHIIKSIAIGYGTYKAAIALNTLALKGHTGVALIDNTVRSAKIALMKADEALTGVATARETEMAAAQAAHTASLQAQLTVEEQSNLVKQLRIATIESLLTAQQQEYMSNLGITASSANYEEVAMSVMTVDQRAALAKTDLSAKSAIYRAALEKEVAAKNASNASTLAAMRADVKAASAKLESAKISAIEARAASDAARIELASAVESGDATRIATAEKRLEGAVENESLARKAALSASSDFYSKKKLLETAATKTSTIASEADVVAKGTEATATSVLSAITGKCTLALKALWASMLTNPIGWIVGLIGLIVSAITLFSDNTDDAKTIQGEFQDELNQSTEDLKVNMAVLQNTATGTETHKKALDKINEICKEYNKTLLDENSTLEDQKKKYNELIIAIQGTTAEKIKAKYVEQAMKDLTEKQTSALEDLKDAAKEALYDTGETQLETTGGNGTHVEPIYEASENIRNASPAVWEQVNSMAIEAADKLKTLTGKAYQDAFNESISKIMAAVKAGTQANDKEMAGFKANIVSNLQQLSSASKDCYDQVNKATISIERMVGIRMSNQPAQQALTTANSFEELENKAKDTQKQIDAINAKKLKVQADYTQLNGLLNTLNMINGLIGKKTSGLNTEKGISDRISQLKAERAEVAINGKEYKDYSRQINQLEAKLPQNQAKSSKSASSAESKEDQLAQKRIALQEKETQAELKAEQSRISIMDDGYEKRKAQLDLQHKQTLADIKKEENDLAKARKEAGMGGLTAKDTNYFNQQRTNEELNYNKQAQKLFDGEIEYKKAQYELYWKWFNNMGANVANTQFAKLLQGGASFKDYLETELKKLNDKKASGQKLSEGEANNLINLKVQYDEVIGAKSALDQFKESLSQSISSAKTLNEKLEAIAKAKEKIKNGSSVLVGADEKAAGSLFANEKEDEVNKEVIKLVDQYKNYSQQRLEIEKKYNDDIKVLTDQRNKAQSKGDTETANKLNSAIAKATKDKGTALIKNDLDALKSSPEYIRAFENLKQTSTETLNDLLSQFEQAKEAAAKTMDPEQLREYTNTMMGIVNELTERNPFKAIADGKKELAKAENDLKKAEKELKAIQNGPDKGSEKEVQAIKNVNKAKDDYINKNHQVKQAEKKVTDEVKDLCDNVSKVGDAVGGQTGAIISMIGDIGSFTMGAIQGFSSAAEASSTAISTIEKASVILSIISAAFQIANKIADMFGADYTEYNKAKQAYEDYVSVLDEVIDKQKELVESMDNENAINSYKYAISLIKEESAAARQLGKDRLNAGASIGSHSIGVRIKNGMSSEGWQQAEDALGYSTFMKATSGRMEGLFDLSSEQLAKLKNDAPIFWAKLDGDVRDYLQEIIDSNDKLDEMKSKLNESLTGVDFDTFSGDILSSLEDVDTKAEDVFNNISEYMRKALIQNMWKNQFKDQIEKWYQMWSDAMNPDGEGGSTITPSEQAALDTLKNSIVTGATSAARAINDQFDTAESQDALEGAVKSMSEETGSLIAGRLNAIVINQGNNNTSLRAILIQTSKIVDNTNYCRHLESIAATLKNMDTKGASLLSQGIS
jgi:hypothetical protein